MPDIKVSVIVPVYNVEKYLPKCLDSLVNQTLQEIEILVVNDGSPDNSQAIINDYAARYPDKIRALIKENGGLSDARNFGIRHAQGEYIGFVDSDDYVDIDMYERLYKRAAQTDADVVCSPFAYEYANKVQRTYYTDKEHLFGYSVLEKPDILKLTNSYAWNKLYRRAFWLKGNYQFPKGQYFEDSALIYGLMLDANKIEYVNTVFYHYIKTREGAITNSLDRRVFDIFKSCDSIIAAFSPHCKFNVALRHTMIYLCLKHIFVRVRDLSQNGDNALTKEFLNHAYHYLDTKLPEWRTNSYITPGKNDGIKLKLSKFVRRHQMPATVYYTLPASIKKLPGKALRFLKRVVRKLTTPRKKAEKAAEKVKLQKRAAIQSFGLSLIEFVQELLREYDICSFADFGTMLGIIREGRLLAHDLDVDIGVILNEPFDIHRVRVAMERNGFTLWRQYINGEQVVEESYKLNGLKVDFNYYQISDNCSKTWLFYKKPEYKYQANNQRHIVEMTYSPIREMQTVNIDGHQIVIPLNAEQLLEEKYGASWKTPDKGWIYWQSPAAIPLEDIGHFITHHYNKYKYVSEKWFSTCNKKSLELLKNLQQQELSILQEVDRICRENGLTYYLGEGTLLGAMRHGGFIPWDDDVDILMPMDDYQKFLQIAPGKIHDTFAVQHYTMTDNYWSVFTKVRLLDNNEYYQESLVGITEYNGPYIDIFPLCRMNDMPVRKLRLLKEKLTFYRKAISYQAGDTHPKSRRTKLYRLISYYMPLKFLYKQLDRLYCSADCENGAYYVNLASYYAINKQKFKREAYGTPRYVPFENLMLPVPQEAERILACIYGKSWNKMPEYAYRKIKHSLVHRTKDNGKENMTIC